jgi:ACR3 family arsenite efflux pump ArsB
MMLYPVLAKVRYGELALGLVWGLGPLLMFLLAWP